MTRQRSKLQIFYEILQAIREMKEFDVRVRQIFKKVNLQFSLGDRYIEELEAHGFIKLGVPCFNQTVSITPKAYKYIFSWKNLQRMLK